jgi:integrase
MATLENRNGFYSLRWIDESGARKRQSLGKVGIISKREAENILKAKELELSTGAKLLNIGPISHSISFANYAEEYLVWRKQEFPDSQYRIEQIVYQHLIPVFGHLPLDLLTENSVEEYKQMRANLVKTETIVKEIRTLKAIVNRALKKRLILSNPIINVSAPKILDSKPHKYYTSEELNKLYAASGSRAPIWALFANTGMRRTEGLQLKWLNVGHISINIESTEGERTKSGLWRPVPISQGARNALAQLKNIGEYVLPRMRPESLSRHFALDARRAGIDGSLHTLRHTYISHLVLKNVPLRTVQLYAGHSSYTTTEQYAYLQPGRILDAVLALNI